MTRVKICGITNLGDALAAVEYGADALGFIFVPGSPRYVRDDEELYNWLTELPPFVVRVAVCREAHELTEPEQSVFDAVQFYNTDWYRPGMAQMRYIHSSPIRDRSSLASAYEAARKVMPDALLLDAYHPDKLGGSGETFNWEIAREAKELFRKSIILAGGLTPDNVAQAIRAVRPYAVDVSSGVEASPGKKDHGKLRAFMQAVREADAEQK